MCGKEMENNFWCSSLYFSDRMLHLEDLKAMCWNHLTPSFSELYKPHLTVSFLLKRVHFRNSVITILYNFKSISFLLLLQLLKFFFQLLFWPFKSLSVEFLPCFCPTFLFKVQALCSCFQSLTSPILNLYLWPCLLWLLPSSGVSDSRYVCSPSSIFASTFICSLIAMKHCPYDLLPKQLLLTGPIGKLMNGSWDQLEKRRQLSCYHCQVL